MITQRCGHPKDRINVNVPEENVYLVRRIPSNIFHGIRHDNYRSAYVSFANADLILKDDVIAESLRGVNLFHRVDGKLPVVVLRIRLFRNRGR